MKYLRNNLHKFKSRIISSLRPARVSLSAVNPVLEETDEIIFPRDINFKSPVVGIVKDSGSFSYYPKFERFLRNNNIPYNFLNIHDNQWIEDAKQFDVILWRPKSSPWELEEAREKIYVLERHMNKIIYPSFDEIIFYENKILQYHIFHELNFPVIPTFISHNYDETREWISQAEYPFVSKIKTGSGSFGTMLIKNKLMAKIYVEKVFRIGKSTYWPSVRQKNYVFFQKYVRNHGFDLRVIMVDNNNIFGYHRLVPKGDFRASGMNIISHEELPLDAVKIALNITEKLDFTNLAVDFLQSKEDDKFYIIESANFINVDKPYNLTINEIHGKYRYNYDTDTLIFEKGDFWLQEIILKRFFEKIMYKQNEIQEIYGKQSANKINPL